MKHLLLLNLFCIFLTPLFSQNKKPIDHTDVHRWRKIEQQKLSNNGQWAVWAQTPVSEGDASLHLWSAASGATLIFPRGTEAQFSDDSKWLVFKIKPALDTLKALRRKKVKDEDLPKDSLGIYDLSNGNLEKIPRLKNFSIPEKWSGWLAFQIEMEKPAAPKKDTAAVKPDTVKTTVPPPTPPNGSSKAKKKSPKKEDKDNGYRLILRNLPKGFQDTIAYVKEFTLAKRGPRLLLHATGKGDTLPFTANPRMLRNGVYLIDLEQYSLRPLLRSKGKFQQLALDDFGRQAAFVADLDTSKARIRPWQLGYWKSEQDSAKLIAGPQSNFLSKYQSPITNPPITNPPINNWSISENARPIFSDDASKLYFGVAPPPVLNDTTLLKEEIVDVEVWTWNDKRLYTQEEIRLENEKKRSYPVVFHTAQHNFIPLGSPELPELRFQVERNARIALGISEEAYTKYITSEGAAHKDLFAVNLETGDKKLIVTDLRCNPRLSPSAKYIAWWSDPDTAWFAWNAGTGNIARLTDNRSVPFFNEETDVPDYPNEHGLAGWIEGDEALLVYDKYDLWKIDPDGKKKPQRITNGRESQTTFRYIKLDPEAHSIRRNTPILLHKFNDITKSEGYTWLNLPQNNDGKLGIFVPFLKEKWGEGYAFTRSPLKARYDDVFLYSKENYASFPNLTYASADVGEKVISNANPQQSEYNWGSIEMVEWTSLTGEKIKGLLAKPEGFDPKKQYPMIVNFYEKLSDNLNSHRAPDFHRSQINYTVYASRGYLVFAPDIPYRIGYPGESAYDAIMSGVTSLIARGFVDPKRVALQGHSWGGYQVAYLVTRTNLFVCAEAGAPVANMTSAYGGIRWESGLNRAFQYEHQQSRIGGSLWEKPKQYIENSPLFALDKVETPLLIMHNDRDGAVPWYQGIELFSGLRRLGKPTWLLNYNDEPHWPVKLQNRIDFQKRMQQFFDHYLMNAPEPAWMKRGVPPMEKGILQGY
ncbi:MAG: prolyl oligopeptidase family serine peptidase [Saprospiraceae bacterium]|nr:prolyl oligopeptidase family serine peptidase [Saprospiraceae bacterium]